MFYLNQLQRKLPTYWKADADFLTQSNHSTMEKPQLPMGNTGLVRNTKPALNHGLHCQYKETILKFGLLKSHWNELN